MNMHTGHRWLPEHMDMLEKLWNGCEISAPEIATQINEAFGLSLSHSAIIGKAHRMYLMKKPSPLKVSEAKFNKDKFTRMYNANMPHAEIMRSFGLHNTNQVEYRAKKLGLWRRKYKRHVEKPKSFIPVMTGKPPTKYIGKPTGADDRGLPRQTYEMVNHGSKKWFERETPCNVMPCAFWAVPTGFLCFEHGGMM